MATRPFLIIEDDAATTDLLVEALADQSYAVEAVTTLQEAHARLRTQGPHAYDLVLSNSFAHRSDTPFAWLDELCQQPGAPVVIIAGHHERAFPGWRTHGGAAFLTKPVDLDALTALVASLCGAADAPAARS